MKSRTYLNPRKMKITTARVLRELQEKHGWETYLYSSKYEQDLVREVIKDAIIVINDILKQQKNITIK